MHIDACGFTPSVIRRYDGYAHKGRRVYGLTSEHRRPRTSLIAALKTQTKVTAAIQHEFEIKLESFKSLLGQDVFVRELYADGIRQYSSEQAYALRQAYLVVYEPSASELDSLSR